MKRLLEYDNDEKGRFYIVEHIDGKESTRIVLSDIHDFSRLIRYLEQNSRSFNWTLKPVPGLAEKLLDEVEKGKKLDYTDRRDAMDLGLVDGGRWKGKFYRR